MIQLTRHFRLGEFTKSRTAMANNINNSLTDGTQPFYQTIISNIKEGAELLESIRTMVDAKPIIITSGYRHPHLNRMVGGSAGSQHQWGAAVDIECPGLSTKEFHQVIVRSSLPFDQCILEFYKPEDPHSGWVHFGYLRYRLDLNTRLTDNVVNHNHGSLVKLELRRQVFSIK